MSQMRAIETGRWHVNAAVSGISAFVDPEGRVVAEAGLFEPAILRHTIRASDERTWYVRLGDWLPWLALAFLLASIAAPRRRERAAPAPGGLGENARRTLVILPTFEEQPTIEQVLRGIRKAPHDVDVVVVDDSSPDGTASTVRDVMSTDPHIRLIERPERSGLASAYRAGFRVALDEGYDLIVEMDSDLSHDPDELPRLLDAAAEGADLVVGSRYVPGGSVSNWSRGRVALSRAGNTYARVMLGIPLHDATSGFRVYRRELLQVLVSDPIASEGYGFQIELVLRSWQRGATLAEVPITFREREHGHSKISRRIVVEMDSDLSHDPDELPRLLDAAARGADLVVGSRYVPGGSVSNWSRGRVALSRAGNTYARLMLGIPLHDATSGFRVYRRQLLQALVSHPIASEGYGFQIELVLRSWQRGATLAEVPITVREREHGHSKISRRIVVEALWLFTRWGLSDRFRPGRGGRAFPVLSR
jgi:glycosyltransferase involved in cell wall biosynthesis